MSVDGTAAYDGLAGVPPLVGRAVEVAREAGFGPSCRPEQGRLLHALAGGAEVIGETGTGCGVGLAWLVSGARPGTRVVSVERDARWAATAAQVFVDHPWVTVVHGDWREIHREGPYDLLVLDGGGQGKHGEPAADPYLLLRPGGTLVVDDLTPARHWPPRFGEDVDRARMHWFDHPGLDAAELRLAPGLATLVATRRFPGATEDRSG
ncbi:O-methyltransferase [Streptosporangium sp. DT93]|uniref:O-methyltransferase n=1 Tax=Streptosporangium sp. DT93 TaxID=3393428 RepID=UPI003CEB0642